MPMLRTGKCDLCERIETEKVYGSGWEGWCIIQGIAAKAPEDGVPLTTENTSMMLCPFHKDQVSEFINKLQEEM